MATLPLSQAELDFLGDALMELGNNDSVLDVSELEGFLTALACSPEPVPLEVWQAEIWGGQPYWPEPATAKRFNELVERQFDEVRASLAQAPDQFEPLLFEREIEGELFTIAEEWCFGFMRGVTLAGWPALPEAANTALDAIALHGTEAGFDRLENFSVEQHQASIREIGPAAARLFCFFQR